MWLNYRLRILLHVKTFVGGVCRERVMLYHTARMYTSNMGMDIVGLCDHANYVSQFIVYLV